MKKLKVIGLMVVISALSIFSGVTKSFAVPNLQLYVEGSTYDPINETWVTSHHPDPINLQVIGAHLNIYDVKLSIAVPKEELGIGTVTIDGSSPLSFSNYGIPVTGDGSLLPAHGVYPASYTTYFIGDFTPQYTVYNMSPGETGSALGEIKRFDISISGFSWVHFDAFDHVVKSENHWKYVQAPFSHDAEYMPEPSSLILLGMGLLGLAGAKKRKKRKVID